MCVKCQPPILLASSNMSVCVNDILKNAEHILRRADNIVHNFFTIGSCALTIIPNNTNPPQLIFFLHMPFKHVNEITVQDIKTRRQRSDRVREIQWRFHGLPVARRSGRRNHGVPRSREEPAAAPGVRRGVHDGPESGKHRQGEARSAARHGAQPAAVIDAALRGGSLLQRRESRHAHALGLTSTDIVRDFSPIRLIYRRLHGYICTEMLLVPKTRELIVTLFYLASSIKDAVLALCCSIKKFARLFEGELRKTFVNKFFE